MERTCLWGIRQACAAPPTTFPGGRYRQLESPVWNRGLGYESLLTARLHQLLPASPSALADVPLALHASYLREEILAAVGWTADKGRTTALGASPYVFLGPADYVEHEGSRPMAVTWKLRRQMPKEIFLASRAAAA